MIPAFTELETLDLFQLDGGLVDTPNLARIPQNSAEVLVNAEFTKLGVERRPGRQKILSNTPLSTHLVCQGAIFYELRSLVAGQRQVIVQDEFLYFNDGGLWHGGVSLVEPATAADVIGNNTEIGSFVQYHNKLFFADGGVLRRYYDGITLSIHDWGWLGGTLPTPTLGAASAGGSLSDGEEYCVVYTYYSTITGAETNPSLPVCFTPTAPDLTRTITAPADPDWTAEWDTIRVYRTFGGGAGEYFFEKEVGALGDHSTTSKSFTVSVADDELGSAVAFDNDPPPQIRYLALFEEQIIAQDALDPTAIVWSKPGNPYAWPATNKIYIERDGGGDIEAIFVMLGRLFVVKRRQGIFELTPNTEGSFNVAVVTRGYGCLSYHSLIQAHDHAFWLDTKGFVRFDGQNVVNISDGKIRQTFNRFKPYWESAAALDHPQKRVPVGVHDRQPNRDYCRWIAFDFNEDVVYHLIYDLARDAWLLHRPGPTTPTPAAGSRDRVLYWGQDFYSGERFVLTQDDQGRSFHLNTTFLSSTPVWDDATYDYWFRWRSSAFGDGFFDVVPKYVDIEIERSTTGQTVTPLTLEFYRNADEVGDVYTQTFPLYDTGARRKTYRMNLNAKVCKRMAVGLKLDGQDSDLKVLGMRVSFRPRATRLIGR